MQDIINALPEAANQVSELITLIFSSGLGLIVVPFIFVSLLGWVLSVFRGSSNAKK